MIVEPPGEPQANAPRPGITAIVGHIEESMRLPGATALASPWTRPYMFVSPGLVAKSSISLFMRKPRPGATRALPKESFNVVVIETTIPAPSTTEKCVVVGFSGNTRARSAVGVARSGLMEATRRFARAGSTKSFWSTPGKAGSPRNSLRSRKARFSISASQCIAGAPWARRRSGTRPTASAISARTGPEEGAGVVKTSAPRNVKRRAGRTFAS